MLENVEQATDNPTKQRHPDHDRDEWGTALWGSGGLWGDYDRAVFVVDLEVNNALEHEFRMSGTRFALISLALNTTIQPRARRRTPVARSPDA